jgi:hypothetical protein
MSTSLFDRLWRVMLANRLAVVLGLGVVAAAVVAGIIMGGAMLVGVVGVMTALVAFALLAWRSRRMGEQADVAGGTVLTYFALAAVLTFGLIQLVPYGRAHSNPPTIGEPAWSSPQTRELMVNACYGCHSNEVEWPWYSNIAPVSWVVTDHADGGRNKVNYSEFSIDDGDADKTIETIREGSMPPSYFTVFGLHPEAKLSDQEIADLIAGLKATPGMDEDDDREDEDDD